MITTELIYKSAGCPKLETREISLDNERCCVCGKIIKSGIPRKNFISANFNDNDVICVPSSNWGCKACAWVLGENQLRRSSFTADGRRILYLKKAELSKWIITPPRSAFVFCITTSYKKHLSFKAPVNASRNQYIIQFDDQKVFVDTTIAREQLKIIEKLYSIFTKTAIRTGSYYTKSIKEFGVSRWRRYENKILQWRNTPLFTLMLYAANRKNAEVKKKNGK